MNALLCAPCAMGSRTAFLAGSSRLPTQRVSMVAQRRAASPVLAMAKPTAASEFRKLSDEDISSKVVQLKEDLFRLRLAQSTRQGFTSSDFRKKRHEVARLLTVQRERELEKGVNKRQSRAQRKATKASKASDL